MQSNNEELKCKKCGNWLYSFADSDSRYCANKDCDLENNIIRSEAFYQPSAQSKNEEKECRCHCHCMACGQTDSVVDCPFCYSEVKSECDGNSETCPIKNSKSCQPQNEAKVSDKFKNGDIVSAKEVIKYELIYKYNLVIVHQGNSEPRSTEISIHPTGWWGIDQSIKEAGYKSSKVGYVGDIFIDGLIDDLDKISTLRTPWYDQYTYYEYDFMADYDLKFKLLPKILCSHDNP